MLIKTYRNSCHVFLNDIDDMSNIILSPEIPLVRILEGANSRQRVVVSIFGSNGKKKKDASCERTHDRVVAVETVSTVLAMNKALRDRVSGDRKKEISKRIKNLEEILQHTDYVTRLWVLGDRNISVTTHINTGLGSTLPDNYLARFNLSGMPGLGPLTTIWDGDTVSTLSSKEFLGSMLINSLDMALAHSYEQDSISYNEVRTLRHNIEEALDIKDGDVLFDKGALVISPVVADKPYLAACNSFASILLAFGNIELKRLERGASDFRLREVLLADDAALELVQDGLLLRGKGTSVVLSRVKTGRVFDGLLVAKTIHSSINKPLNHLVREIEQHLIRPLVISVASPIVGGNVDCLRKLLDMPGIHSSLSVVES